MSMAHMTPAAFRGLDWQLCRMRVPWLSLVLYCAVTVLYCAVTVL